MIFPKRNIQRTGATPLTIRQSDYATYDDINALRKRIQELEKEVAVKRDTKGNVYLLGIPTTSQGVEIPAGQTSGEKVVILEESVTAPTVSPTGKAVLYVQGGAVKILGPGGTITTIAAAEPHCPVCGSDFVLEWENKKYGKLQFCVLCLAKELGSREWIIRLVDEAKLEAYREARVEKVDA